MFGRSRAASVVTRAARPADLVPGRRSFRWARGAAGNGPDSMPDGAGTGRAVPGAGVAAAGHRADMSVQVLVPSARSPRRLRAGRVLRVTLAPSSGAVGEGTVGFAGSGPAAAPARASPVVGGRRAAARLVSRHPVSRHPAVGNPMPRSPGPAGRPQVGDRFSPASAGLLATPLPPPYSRPRVGRQSQQESW